MIRIFNHYLHRSVMLRAVFDFGVVFVAVLAALAAEAGGLDTLGSIGGTHAFSLAAGLLLINSATGFYEPGYNRPLSQSIARALMALALALPLTWFVVGLLPAHLTAQGFVQWATMAGVTAVVVRRVYAAHWAGAARARQRVLILGTGPAALTVGRTIAAHDPDSEIVGYLASPNEQRTDVPADRVLPEGACLMDTVRRHRVNEIVVALQERRAGAMPMRQLLDCKLRGVRVQDLNSHFERTRGQIRIDFVNAGWLIFGEGFNQGAWRTAVKRLSDIVFSSLLILLSAPVMLLTALAIRLESRGGVFYRQERVGLNGDSFQVIKFRSMRSDAESDGTPRWATSDDDRITRVGHVIRRLRIDELPQLFNVLRGGMSLVGPRPERPYFVEQLTQQIPYYAVRHSVKPGVTGWAQVRYQYGSTVEDSQEKLQYDLYYVKNHTLFLDLVILFETIGVVLTGKGAR
jgi:sugar transferase (PEP-CTERM system associated)